MKTILLFLTATFFSVALYPQTPIPCGDISGMWTLSGSPYEILGETTIPDGATLTIEPGVLVEWQGSYTMFVEGQILAQGTETDSITFTAADTATGWKGIRFLSTPPENDTSIFDYCVFTYANAYGPYPDNFGGALAFLDFGKIIVDHCRFAFNKAIWQNIVKPGGGAAIALINCSPVIRNSIFEHNLGCIGAALVLSTDTTLVENNVFRYNRAPYLPDYRAGNGGAILCKWSSYAMIRGNTFYSNHADRNFGAIFFWNYGNAHIEKNLFYENSANLHGGALGMDSCSSPTLINNTIAFNNAGNKGGGIEIALNSNPEVCNTILWGNTAQEGNQVIIQTADCIPDFYYCDIEGGVAAFGGFPFLGIDSVNIDADPEFDNPLLGSFYLCEDLQSPCIDAGDPDSIYNDPDGSRNDMGAIWPPSVCLTGVPEINIDNVFIYPNPTTGIVNFQFSTVSFQRISLKIYDLHGREVATVVDKMMPAGEHTVSFDAASLSAGVYVYKKTEVSSQKSEVGKLIKY